MPLSWNEIKTRAVNFCHTWKDTVREEADAKSILVEFLNIFGISQKSVTAFVHRVKNSDQGLSYSNLQCQVSTSVDLFYKRQPFTSEVKSIDYLFEMYEKYSLGVFQIEKKVKNIK